MMRAKWGSSGEDVGTMNGDVKGHRRTRATGTRRVLTSQQETDAGVLEGRPRTGRGPVLTGSTQRQQIVTIVP